MYKSVCTRNGETFPDIDFFALKKCGFGALKPMSQTKPDVFRRIRKDNPNIKFITRLYHPSFNTGGHLSPQDFFGAMQDTIAQLMPYCQDYEVHNEPNHTHGVEGWGSGDEHARDFNLWFQEVYRLLKTKFPDCQFGFPGLAVPDFLHRDVAWIKICSQAIHMADFLCCHSYWQNFDPRTDKRHLNDYWGLNFKTYHDLHPDKAIHITEAGNSAGMEPHYQLKEDMMANELVEWYREVAKYDYIRSASPFIFSSTSPEWENWDFCWINGDRMKSVVHAVAGLPSDIKYESEEK